VMEEPFEDSQSKSLASEIDSKVMRKLKKLASQVP
jgi:hypothetical protein